MPANPPAALAIYHSVPPGGARKAAYEHARRLQGAYDLSFYHIGQPGMDIQDIGTIAASSHTVPFSPSSLFHSPFGRLNSLIYIYDLLRLRRISKEMAGVINRGGASRVLSHTCQYTQAPWLLQFLQKPVIYYCHEYNRIIHDAQPVPRPYQSEKGYRLVLNKADPARHLLHALLRRIEKQGLRAAQRVLVNSSFMQQEIKRLYGIDAHVAQLAVDLGDYANLNLPKANFVLSVGVISPLKGFDFIIEGLGRLPKENRPRFVLVGFREAPHERSYLEKLAHEKEVDLTILCNASQGELIRLYNQAMLTLYTPHREPFGLVPIESMACGTPVLGIDEGGVRETVLEGKTGWLVPRDTEALAERLACLLDDPTQVEQMGRTAHTYVNENWSWHRSMEILEQHIRAVGPHQ